MEDNIEQFVDEIFSVLGPGYSERVYHNAFEVHLRKNNIPYETERTLEIKYMNHLVGHVRADLIINNKIVVELKVGSKIKQEHIEQCKRYMKLLNLPKGMVICFPENDNLPEILELVSQIVEYKEKREDDEYDVDLYEELRKERLEIARETKLPPYCIFYNSELKDVSNKKPKSIEELMTIKGFKEVKCQKYGQRIIEIVSKYSK